MRYLVTGATGFIGAEVVRQLAEAGHDVVALARNPEGVRPDLFGPDAGPRVALAAGDVTDKDSMRLPMTGADGVFHIAGWYKLGARDKTPAYGVNVAGTRNVLELAGELGVGKIVYTSSLAVFSDTHGRMVDEDYHFAGDHLSEYDLTKWKAHHEVAVPLMRQGLPLVIVQPGAVYGPGDWGPLGDAFRSFLRGKLPLTPKGSAYCWGHVVDIAKAHVLAMDKGRTGEAYIIAGPCYELREALEVLHELSGARSPRFVAPPRLLRVMASLLAVVDRVHPIEGNYSPETVRVGAGATYLGSNAKARRELGIEMRPLEQGLRDSLPWYLQSAREGR